MLVIWQFVGTYKYAPASYFMAITQSKRVEPQTFDIKSVAFTSVPSKYLLCPMNGAPVTCQHYPHLVIWQCVDIIMHLMTHRTVC